MSLPGALRRAALLAAALLPLAAPAVGAAQEPAPLVKSEVVRLLVSDTYGPEERLAIVRRSCLTFTPSEEDMEDFRRLGAGPELLDAIRACTRSAPPVSRAAPAGPVEVPPPPGEVSVSPPGVLVPSDTGGAPFLGGPEVRVELRAYLARPPRAGPDRDNLLARVEAPPRLRNPAGTQRMLRRSAPDEALRAGEPPRCVVWVYVDATGSVREARIEASSGLPGFDEAALEAARSMEFTPATTGGRPVGTWVQQTLSLRGRG